MFEAGIGLWFGFNVLILALLALDLGVFHRKSHEVSLKEATAWSVVWITLGLLFGLGIYLYWDTLVPGSAYTGEQAALAYVTGYLLEKSLAVDNIFVFVLVFSYFNVPAAYQHRVLFWGILGALVMRAILILAGVALIQTFHWVVYVFGAFLVLTGLKMLRAGDLKLEPEKNPLVKLARRLFPVTEAYEGDRFFIRLQTGKRVVKKATPLLLVLMMIEATDLVFAVDSIPAILAVTQEPFLVYTSNVFAILGLRAMYFMLAGVVPKFVYLKPALSFILVWVGAKMLLVDLLHVPMALSLAIVVTVLTIAVLASIWRNRQLAAEGKPLGPVPLGVPEEETSSRTPPHVLSAKR
ncbi:MAG TPA: TerC family protein [Rhodothermales bacterium]|nr:TerC family protein [Rhodothermales bacterium]